VRTGDMDRTIRYMRDQPGKAEEILAQTEKKSGRTALHFAVEGGHTTMVEYLLNKGALVDARDKLLRTPLHISCL